MDSEIGDLPVGDVLIRGGLIAAVAPTLDAGGAEVIDATGAIVIPGLIDGHRHLWQALLRGAAADWSLQQYMAEARSMYCGCFDAEAAYLSNYLGGLESLSAGITTVVDHSHLQTCPQSTDALVRGLLDSGVGGVFCYALQNVPTFLDGAPVDIAAVRELVMRSPDEWHDENATRVRAKFFGDPGQRLRFGVALPETAPYLPLDALRALLVRVGALEPFLVTGHWDVGAVDSTIAALCEHQDWPAHTSLTHCNHLDDDEMAALAHADVGICTTPDIECGMGSGPLVARRFLD
ncbi:amidohydrolase family protein, partial [uncultured Mycobacterium sp.]|uniref:amidohydrolase family protein n=1 Tax=uncultured Mycobacterium sp. TaxID=171292 RepID=UPI0035CB871A